MTVGTIFHQTHLDLQKWFLAVSIILNARKGISSRQLARDLEVNKNTAWYMAMRIRRAMMEQRELLTGIVEMDETYLSKDKDENGKYRRGRGTSKRPIVGMMQRGGRGEKSALLPEYISVKNIQPFISDDLRRKFENPVPYLDKQGKEKNGVEATILADICDIWITAREKSALTKKQEETAKRAYILMRGFANVGIIALVDEATDQPELPFDEIN